MGSTGERQEVCMTRPPLTTPVFSCRSYCLRGASAVGEYPAVGLDVVLRLGPARGVDRHGVRGLQDARRLLREFLQSRGRCQLYLSIYSSQGHVPRVWMAPRPVREEVSTSSG